MYNCRHVVVKVDWIKLCVLAFGPVLAIFLMAWLIAPGFIDVVMILENLLEPSITMPIPEITLMLASIYFGWIIFLFLSLIINRGSYIWLKNGRLYIAGRASIVAAQIISQEIDLADGLFGSKLIILGRDKRKINIPLSIARDGFRVDIALREALAEHEALVSSGPGDTRESRGHRFRGHDT